MGLTRVLAAAATGRAVAAARRGLGWRWWSLPWVVRHWRLCCPTTACVVVGRAGVAACRRRGGSGWTRRPER